MCDCFFLYFVRGEICVRLPRHVCVRELVCPWGKVRVRGHPQMCFTELGQACLARRSSRVHWHRRPTCGRSEPQFWTGSKQKRPEALRRNVHEAMGSEFKVTIKHSRTFAGACTVNVNVLFKRFLFVKRKLNFTYQRSLPFLFIYCFHVSPFCTQSLKGEIRLWLVISVIFLHLQI